MKLIGGFLMNGEGGVGVDETALFMPVSILGKPIGFINGVSEKTVNICFWAKDWKVKRDKDGNIEGLELLDVSKFLDAADESYDEEDLI